jgi:hypothetical protein
VGGNAATADERKLLTARELLRAVDSSPLTLPPTMRMLDEPNEVAVASLVDMRVASWTPDGDGAPPVLVPQTPVEPLLIAR